MQFPQMLFDNWDYTVLKPKHEETFRESKRSLQKAILFCSLLVLGKILFAVEQSPATFNLITIIFQVCKYCYGRKLTIVFIWATRLSLMKEH